MTDEVCKACQTRRRAGFEGQCPACASERSRLRPDRAAVDQIYRTERDRLDLEEARKLLDEVAKLEAKPGWGRSTKVRRSFGALAYQIRLFLNRPRSDSPFPELLPSLPERPAIQEGIKRLGADIGGSIKDEIES